MYVTHLIMQASRFPLVDSYLHRLRDGVDISWRAIIELLLIAAVIYPILRFLEGTRGARLLQAVLAILTALLAIAIFSRILELDRILVLYPYFVGGAFLITLVVFQPELRRGLMRIGESIGRASQKAQSHKLIEPVVTCAANLSRRKVGALMAIERSIPLGAIEETGVMLDSEITHELLETIFWPGSALHDLGVIISHGRVAAAGCEFPLAEVDSGHRMIGSRHRAALGMSLESDALIVVVSEETGAISIATRGTLRRGLSVGQLREILGAVLFSPVEELSEATESAAGESEVITAVQEDTKADQEETKQSDGPAEETADVE